MNIELQSPERLIVRLSHSELNALGLTYHSISYTSEATRAVLQRLLSDAAEKTGFEAGHGKLLIEVFPAPDMGCMIQFTRFAKKRLREVGRKEAVYEFSTPDAMLCCMEQLYRAGLTGGGLYSLDGRYRLIFPCKSPSSAESIILEYARALSHDKTTAAYTREHYKKLCSNPPRTVGGALFRRS